mmetsp:Transcript_20129/g.20495  ORF Transcript_20129/g.20495 Transcript_20129/m.20495 type:complete len:100 (+) Transcript_20129:38-337(+)
MHDSKTTDDDRQKYQITSVTSQPQSQSHTNPTTNKQPMNQSTTTTTTTTMINSKKHRNKIKSLRKETKYSSTTPKNKTPDLGKSGRQEECSSSQSRREW